MRRFVLASSLALSLAMLTPLAAAAVGQTVTPSSQTHAHGVASNWVQSWSGPSPYDVSFCPSINAGDIICFGGFRTSTTSINRTYTFYPCSTTKYKQYAFVQDAQGGQSTINTYATESGGTPC